MNKNITLELKKHLDLRCGQNPHQAAALYSDVELEEITTLNHSILTFEDLIDAEAASRVIFEVNHPTIVLAYHGEIVYASYEDNFKMEDVASILPYCSLVYSNEAGSGLLTMEDLGLFPRTMAAPFYSEYALRVISKNNIPAMRLNPRRKAFLSNYITRFGYVFQENDDVPENTSSFNEDEILAYAIAKANKSWTAAFVKDGRTFDIQNFRFDLNNVKFPDETDLVFATDFVLKKDEVRFIPQYKSIIAYIEEADNLSPNIKLLQYQHMRL